MPATICLWGRVMVKRGFRMEKRGITASLANTWPIFSRVLPLVMTEPAFISDPVPTMVSTQPTGRMGQSGSSKRTKYLSQGSSAQSADTASALA